MSYPPRAFIGNSKLSLKLLSGYSVSCGSKEINGIEPLMKRSSRLLKKCSLAGIDVITTELTGMRPALRYAMILCLPVALFADRITLGIKLHDLCETSIVIRELLLKLIERVFFHLTLIPSEYVNHTMIDFAPHSKQDNGQDRKRNLSEAVPSVEVINEDAKGLLLQRHYIETIFQGLSFLPDSVLQTWGYKRLT